MIKLLYSYEDIIKYHKGALNLINLILNNLILIKINEYTYHNNNKKLYNSNDNIYKSYIKKYYNTFALFHFYLL